ERRRPCGARAVPRKVTTLGADIANDSARDAPRDRCTAGFQSPLRLFGVRTGSALVEHKISAPPPKPNICALMSLNSSFLRLTWPLVIWLSLRCRLASRAP